MTCKWILILILALLLTGFGSCTGSIEQVCAQQLGGSVASLDRAHLELGNRGRELASTGSPAPLPRVLSAEEREHWKQWAEDRLKEAQNLFDLAQAESHVASLQNEISSLANDIVSFHGFCHKGERHSMMAALTKIRDRTARVRGLACKSLQ